MKGNRWLILLVCMTGFCSSAWGQNNPYKIDDRLYTYYKQCNRIVMSPQVLLMADTLFQMAEQENDVKAQCLAKNLKSEHYYYTNDFDALLREKEVVADFARRTPYKQYIFGAWNRIVSYLLRYRQYQAAIQEIKEYQKEALRLNVPYGIGHSYLLMGNTYFQQSMYGLAVEQYKQGISYNTSAGKEEENYQMYNSLCSCHINLEKYDEAEKYALKSLEAAPIPSAKGSPYIGLLRVFTLTHQIDKASRIMKILVEYRRQGMVKGANLENYYIVSSQYYLESGDIGLALSYSDSIKDDVLKLSRKSAIYARTGRYKEAYACQKMEKWVADSLNQSSHAEQLAFQNARFNNQKLELEKKQLSLQNAEMRLEHLQAKAQMLEMEKEQEHIELENRNLQLEQQRTATALEKEKAQKQQLELVNKEEELQRIQLERSTTRHKWVTVVSLLLMLAGFSIFYAYTLRERAKHLHIEKKAAEKACREAERADRLKSAFLQNMSHEIRTPLNAIIGFNDLLNDDTLDLGKEERQELVTQLHVNSNLLLTLVRDVLDLSKLESGNYSISNGSVRASDVCKSALMVVRQQVSPGVKLLLNEPQEEIVLNTDEQRLRQILTNLLGNACKYTDKGSITLEYKQTGNKVLFAVTDTGSGIPKDKAELIFQRFEKLGSFKPGFGLGLSICRSLLQLLGGNIHLDTDYVNGARFVFEIPLR